MEQLLQMRTTPIVLEMTVNRAKLQMSSEQPSCNMTRAKGHLQIEHSYPKLNIDTYEARSSMDLKTCARSVQDFAAEGVQAGYDATARIAEEGNMLMDIQNKGNTIGEIAYQNMQSTLDTELAFLPSVPADISWDPQQLSMQYEMDKLSFDWRTSQQPEMQYTPASVEYHVKQYPKLEIQYVGKPLYVPPSASPDYVPPKLDMTA
ncbi:MAG TPA: DUF6470 family protein [Oscillospiraceae bacterium]|nr:DUF6470 family protein [Oscillospiraceae bacterium]